MYGVRQLSAWKRWRNYARHTTGQFSPPEKQIADLKKQTNKQTKQNNKRKTVVILVEK